MRIGVTSKATRDEYRTVNKVTNISNGKRVETKKRQAKGYTERHAWDTQDDARGHSTKKEYWTGSKINTERKKEDWTNESARELFFFSEKQTYREWKTYQRRNGTSFNRRKSYAAADEPKNR